MVISRLTHSSYQREWMWKDGNTINATLLTRITTLNNTIILKKKMLVLGPVEWFFCPPDCTSIGYSYLCQTLESLCLNTDKHILTFFIKQVKTFLTFGGSGGCQQQQTHTGPQHVHVFLSVLSLYTRVFSIFRLPQLRLWSEEVDELWYLL